jgi:hypothetical protein
MKPPRSVLIRDAVIFMLKLWIDGLKDIALTATALGALVLDIARGRRADRYLFYRVIRLGERFDLWLNLYGAAEAGSRHEQGFFGASRAGDDTFLGKLEELTGGERGAKKPK